MLGSLESFYIYCSSHLHVGSSFRGEQESSGTSSDAVHVASSRSSEGRLKYTMGGELALVVKATVAEQRKANHLKNIFFFFFRESNLWENTTAAAA